MKKLFAMVGIGLALAISSCSSLTGSKLVSAEGLEKAKKLLEKDPYTGKAFTKVMLWAGQPLEENFESVTAQYFDQKQGKDVSQTASEAGLSSPDVSTDEPSKAETFTLAEIPFDKVPAQVDNMIKFLSSQSELEEMEGYIVHSLVFTKENGQIKQKYEIQCTKKGEGKSVEGRNIVTNYYQFHVTPTSDGQYEVSEW